MPGFTTLALQAAQTYPDPHSGAHWLPLREQLGIGAFGINAWRARAGQEIIERHDELVDGAAGHQEVYLVVEGEARFTIGGADVRAPAGTLIFVEDPALERVAVASQDGTLVLAIGAEPGRPFEVSEWERRSLASERPEAG